MTNRLHYDLIATDCPFSSCLILTGHCISISFTIKFVKVLGVTQIFYVVYLSLYIFRTVLFCYILTKIMRHYVKIPSKI